MTRHEQEVSHKTNLITPDVALVRMAPFKRRDKTVGSYETAQLSLKWSQDNVDECSRGRNRKVFQQKTNFSSKLKILLFLFLVFVKVCLAQDGTSGISDERCFLQAGANIIKLFSSPMMLRKDRL